MKLETNTNTGTGEAGQDQQTGTGDGAGQDPTTGTGDGAGAEQVRTRGQDSDFPPISFTPARPPREAGDPWTDLSTRASASTLETTSAMEVNGGVVLRVTHLVRSVGVEMLAEALTFIPGAKVKDGKLVAFHA